ncbi:MAG: lysophospholipid acyltransferase family protein [Hyphomicrobiales bacterium]|nr:lysophospholipid acyltransferase family protein [Hyphomicrobiales bacterium]MBV8442484.1 lysophospholipid acyltransferase family protein [Hyphomicrobiales bacterium]
MARRIGRSVFGQGAIGFLLATYLRLVRRTSGFSTFPEDLDEYSRGRTPLIAAMWHGQHLMMPFARPDTMGPLAALISRHEDAGPQALALQRLGIMPVRGSGGPADRQYYKGGAPAMRELLRLLESGASVALTADVPKTARVAGMGIVTLARLSGRPIVPMAVVASRRIQFNTWDRATLGLPFSQVIVVAGDYIPVSAEADDATMEAARLAVQEGLDEAHRRAYAMVGATDPGAQLRTA